MGRTALVIAALACLSIPGAEGAQFEYSKAVVAQLKNQGLMTAALQLRNYDDAESRRRLGVLDDVKAAIGLAPAPPPVKAVATQTSSQFLDMLDVSIGGSFSSVVVNILSYAFIGSFSVPPNATLPVGWPTVPSCVFARPCFNASSANLLASIGEAPLPSNCTNATSSICSCVADLIANCASTVYGPPPVFPPSPPEPSSPANPPVPAAPLAPGKCGPAFPPMPPAGPCDYSSFISNGFLCPAVISALFKQAAGSLVSNCTSAASFPCIQNMYTMSVGNAPMNCNIQNQVGCGCLQTVYKTCPGIAAADANLTVTAGFPPCPGECPSADPTTKAGQATCGFTASSYAFMPKTSAAAPLGAAALLVSSAAAAVAAMLV